MKGPSVFEYSDPVEYLNASFGALQAAHPQYSLRSWARQMGLAHPSQLSMVLSRKRRLLPSLAAKVSRHFQQLGRLKDSEARFFEVLVLFANAKTADEKHFYEKILASLRPDQRFSTLDLDHFRVISDWYHLAIAEMTELKDFSSDPQWIGLRLGGSVKTSQVQEGIERLIRVGLLERTPEGRLQKRIQRYATPSDVPHQAIRVFHSQMIEKARVALENQSIDERDITAHILTISKEKLPAAKLMIREFRRQIADFLETPGGNAVYQLNIQLFNALEKV